MVGTVSARLLEHNAAAWERFAPRASQTISRNDYNDLSHESCASTGDIYPSRVRMLKHVMHENQAFERCSADTAYASWSVRATDMSRLLHTTDGLPR